MDRTTRVAIYTYGRDDHARQLARCREAVAALGARNSDVLVYSDEAPCKRGRAGLAKLVAAAELGQFELLVVDGSKRLSTGPQLGAIVMTFAKLGVRIRTASSDA